MVLKESTCTHSAGRMMLYGFPLKEIEFALKKTIKKKKIHDTNQIKLKMSKANWKKSSAKTELFA